MNIADDYPAIAASLGLKKITALSRVVLTPAGRFGSLTLAAEHYGISRQTAYYRAKNSRLGWQYARDRS